MLEEAKIAGLIADPAREGAVLAVPPVPIDPALEPQHDSLSFGWQLAEYVPKKRYDSATKKKTWQFGGSRWRTIRESDALHPTVSLRLAGKPDYRPPNLRGRGT